MTTKRVQLQENDVSAAKVANVAPCKPYLTISATKGWATVDFVELWRFRDLLTTLAGRDLKIRYKQTILGVTWVVLQPLLTAGVFSFVFGRLADFPSHGVPYFLFSYAGLLGWNLFANTLIKSSGCLLGNSQLISKVFFPRLVLPLSVIPSVLVDTAVAGVMLTVLMVVWHIFPSWPLLLLPLWLAMLTVLALGCGLCAAALAVSYRDVQYILPVAVQVLLYASPIAYALADASAKLKDPWSSVLYKVNPLAAPLEAIRWSILGVTPVPPTALLCYSGVAAIAALAVGVYGFKRMERKFADVI